MNASSAWYGAIRDGLGVKIATVLTQLLAGAIDGCHLATTGDQHFTENISLDLLEERAAVVDRTLSLQRTLPSVRHRAMTGVADADALTYASSRSLERSPSSGAGRLKRKIRRGRS